ncbi:MAG: membrane bound O-acyl transferase family-domain-containing protein [Planctomycetia bacterium]|nr:membrane bound O-acyl transferase family-domain-containing protein [Planctomycetia bacterium]
MRAIMPHSATRSRLNRLTKASMMTFDTLRLPLLGILATALVYRQLPAWGAMCLWAMTLFYGFKWITYRSVASDKKVSCGRTWGYFFAWPGLDAEAFFSDREPTSRPTGRDYVGAGTTMLVGALTIVVAARMRLTVDPVVVDPLIVGWAAMIGIVTMLHFGLFRLAALAWQSAGVAAEPIMDRPLAAASVAEFWDRRWNKAFRDLAHRWVFEPLVRRVGVQPAFVAGFAFSGLVHDAVISLPARAGYGLPTLYFLLQAGAVLAARSTVGRRCELQHGLRARLFALLAIVGPLGLLFHQPFVRLVVVPLLEALRLAR